VFKGVVDSSVPAAEQLIGIAEAMGAPADAIDEMRAAVVAKKAEDVGAADAAAAYSEEVQGQGEATEEATSALKEYSDALQAMTDPLFGAMNAITGNRDAQLAYRDAVDAVGESQAALDEAIAAHGPNSEEAATATRDLEDANRALDDAQWATVESAAEVDGALAALKDAVERGDVSVDTFKDTLRGWVNQGFLTERQADQAAGAVGGLASQADKADSKRVTIPVSIPGALGAISALDAVTSKVNQVPKNVTIAIGLQVYGQAELNRFAAGSLINKRQHGGPVKAGDPYVVGEAGPELFIPGQSGMIVPGPAMGFGAGGGGGGTVINVAVDLRGAIVPDARSPGFDRLVAESVQRGVRQGGIGLTAGDTRVETKARM
jgi:hypothetical protein